MTTVELIRVATRSDVSEWLRLRHALWPHASTLDLARDVEWYFDHPETHVVFVAVRPGGKLAGFADVQLHNVADECETSPVPFLEGWYVDADVRRLGIGRKLVAAAEDWARERGFREFASDAELENSISRQAHRALGFEESVPMVHFKKRL